MLVCRHRKSGNAKRRATHWESNGSVSQVLDRLCASHLYREAIVSEKRNAGSETPETALQLAIVLQNSCHEMPASLQEKPGTGQSLSKKHPVNSPTAVQRLAALSSTSGQIAPSAAGGKKHAHRRKKVCISMYPSALLLVASAICVACAFKSGFRCAESAAAAGDPRRM